MSPGDPAAGAAANGRVASSLAVALLSPCFWPEVRRGGERLLRDLADGLIARGHRPELITSHPGRPRRDVEDGLPITRHWRPPDGRLRRRGFEDHLTHLPFSYRSLARGEFELAHAFYPTDAVAALRWSRRAPGRPPVLLTYLGLPDRAYLASRRLRARFTHTAARECDALVVVSRAAADAVRRWLGAEAQVIYPGVALERFTPGGERAAEPTLVCPAAPDVPRKRVDLLVRALARVRAEHPGARVVLERPRDAELAARLARPGVELVEIGGDPEALVGLYREAWACVLPSRSEAFGIVLAEALACGTPVVGARDGGIPEVIDRPRIGALFEPDDEQDLARALLETIELSRSRKTAKACRARAEELSPQRAVDAYEELYRGALARRGRVPAGAAARPVPAEGGPVSSSGLARGRVR